MSNMKRAIVLTIAVLAIVAIILVPFIVEGGEYYIKFLFLASVMYSCLIVLWFFIKALVDIWKPIYLDWRKKQ